jgi:transcriptional regulator with XRE-family HTH domain
MIFNTNKVRGLMAEHNLKQTDIAKVINRSEVSLRSKLSGKTDFTATEIAALAKLFNVSPSIFFANQLSNIESQSEKTA